MDKRLPIIGILLLMGAVWGGIILLGDEDSFAVATYNGAKVVTLVPHKAALKCEVVGQGTSTYQMPSGGAWLAEGEVGTKTKLLINVKVTHGNNDLNYLKPRLQYKKCDYNKKNCEEKTLFFRDYSRAIELSDLDLTRNSYYLYTERDPWYSWGEVFSPSTISYTYEKFGLNLYSTTEGFKTVCTSSCDLSCPGQYVRDGLIETGKNSLEFFESVNYIEYWTEPSKVGEQLGGTVWNEDKEEFCFGGNIYSAGGINMESGLEYIYPEAYRRAEECCPGAVISTSYEDKICMNNYEWKTISVDEPETLPQCTSDIQCPGSGQPTCQRDGSKFYKSGWGCGSGTCEQDAKVEVECCGISLGCSSDQTCQNYKCVGGASIMTLSAENVQYQIDTSSEAACTADEGVWKAPYNVTKTSGWGFWESEEEKTVPGECKYPRTPAAAIILMVLGIGVMIFGIARGMFPGILGGVVVMLIGLAYLIIGRMG